VTPLRGRLGERILRLPCGSPASPTGSASAKSDSAECQLGIKRRNEAAKEMGHRVSRMSPYEADQSSSGRISDMAKRSKRLGVRAPDRQRTGSKGSDAF